MHIWQRLTQRERRDTTDADARYEAAQRQYEQLVRQLEAYEERARVERQLQQEEGRRWDGKRLR